MATASARKKPRGNATERAQDLCAELFTQLERDNALLRETLDNMTQGVVMFGPDATLVVSNEVTATVAVSPRAASRKPAMPPSSEASRSASRGSSTSMATTIAGVSPLTLPASRRWSA